jgi:hypothetical protein
VAVQVYLTTNFVDIKANDWRFQEKTIKRMNMIKGVVDTKVPTVLNTTSGLLPAPWSRAASIAWSQASTRAGSDGETVATLRLNLDNMLQKNDTLEKGKAVLTKEVEELKSLKKEFETFKKEQKGMDDKAITEQQMTMDQLKIQMDSLRTQIDTLTQDNSRLQEPTQKSGFFSGIICNAFQTPIHDQSLSTILPSDNLLNIPDNWTPAKGSSKHPRTSANRTLPRESQTVNTNQYSALSDHRDNNDVEFETSAIVADPDTSFVDAHPDSLHLSTTTSNEEVNLSASMLVDGENE